jgi:hypothetical protein
MVPCWDRTHYHLRGNYCSWNCAKSHAISQAKAGTFPQDLTSISLCAFKTSFKGRHCIHKGKACHCYSRFTGVVPAPPKETLQAFGGPTSIAEFRRGAMVIESYAWIPGELHPDPLLKREYLYTMKPLRRTKTIEVEDDEDPIVLIKRRCFR